MGKEKNMNWKNEAIEKLRRYDIMRQALLNIPQEINRLKEESTALRSCSADTVHVTGGGGRQEDARINNLIQRQELEQTLKNVRQWLTIFDRALLAMDEDDLMILQQLYIYPQKGRKMHNKAQPATQRGRGCAFFFLIR